MRRAAEPPCEGRAPQGLGSHHTGAGTRAEGSHGPDGRAGSRGVWYPNETRIPGPERSPRGVRGRQRARQAETHPHFQGQHRLGTKQLRRLSHPQTRSGVSERGASCSCTPRPDLALEAARVPSLRGSWRVGPPPPTVLGPGLLRHRALQNQASDPSRAVPAVSVVSTVFLCEPPPCGFSEAAGQPGPLPAS